ncbi:hypothetical protein [Methylocystis sp. S23]|jgi:hypothetical protein
MKKLLLAPAFLVLTSGFAFAGGHGGGFAFNWSPTVNLDQNVSNLRGHATGLNDAVISQEPAFVIAPRARDIAINHAPVANVTQNINNLSGRAIGANNAVILQTQVLGGLNY